MHMRNLKLGAFMLTASAAASLLARTNGIVVFPAASTIGWALAILMFILWSAAGVLIIHGAAGINEHDSEFYEYAALIIISVAMNAFLLLV